MYTQQHSQNDLYLAINLDFDWTTANVVYTHISFIWALAGGLLLLPWYRNICLDLSFKIIIILKKLYLKLKFVM